MAFRFIRRSITDYARISSPSELIKNIDKIIANPVPCGRDMGTAISKHIMYMDDNIDRRLLSSLLLQISGSLMAIEGLKYEEYIPAFKKARVLLSSLERK